MPFLEDAQRFNLELATFTGAAYER
jgi:hypothetical protein